MLNQLYPYIIHFYSDIVKQTLKNIQLYNYFFIYSSE